MKTNSHHVAAVYDRRKYLLKQPLPLCVPCVLSRLTWFFFLGFLAFSVSAQVQQAWVVRYNNGVLNGTNQAVKMALDRTGNIYITGFSQSTNGNLDYATIKYAPNGNQAWATRFDSSNTTTALPAAMVLDISNNVIVTGSALTVKYDSNGNQLWTAPYAGAAIAVATNGNVCVTGFGTNFDTVKLSPMGTNTLMMTSHSIYGPNVGEAVAIDSSGNVYVAGLNTYANPKFPDIRLMTIKFDANGNQLWNATAGNNFFTSIPVVGSILDVNANFYVLVNFREGNQGQPYCSAAYASSNGAVVLGTSNPTGDGFSLAHGFALDSSNNVFVTGQNYYYYPDSSYGTYKINTNGTYVVTSLYPAGTPTTANAGTAIAVDQANNVYVTGYSPGTNSSNDIVTIKYDNNGNQIWVQRYNGPGDGDDEGNAIAVDASGNVYVTGYETTAAGGTEMVTIKYAPSPTGSKQTNGSFLLQTQGEPGEAFDIQATTNFKSWLDLGLTNSDSNGNLQFLDTNASLFNQRYYIIKPQ